MHKWMRRLRALRAELDEFRPADGVQRWNELMSSLRVAGQPRAYYAAQMVAILDAMHADESIPESSRKAASELAQKWKATPAYQEISDLDGDALEAELSRFRKAGYTYG